MHRFLFIMAIALADAGCALPAAEPIAPADAEFFEAKVRPLLIEHCQQCHGPQKQKGELRLDSRAALLKGNDLGAVIVPGDADKSRLIRAVRYGGEIKMPPKAKLPAAAIDTLTEW